MEERGAATRGWRYRAVELGGGQSDRPSADSPGPFPVQTLRSALCALLVAGVPVTGLAVPTKYRVWPGRSAAQTWSRRRRSWRERGGLARADRGSPAERCIMVSLGTLPLPGG